MLNYTFQSKTRLKHWPISPTAHYSFFFFSGIFGHSVHFSDNGRRVTWKLLKSINSYVTHARRQRSIVLIASWPVLYNCFDLREFFFSSCRSTERFFATIDHSSLSRKWIFHWKNKTKRSSEKMFPYKIYNVNMHRESLVLQQSWLIEIGRFG